MKQFSPILTVAPAVFLAVALTLVQVFLPSAFAAAVVTVIACAVLAVFAVAIRKQFCPALAKDNAASSFFASVCAVLLLLFLGVSVWFRYFVPIEERIVSSNGTVSFFVSVFALLAAIYFFLSGLAPSLLKDPAPRLLWAMAPVLFCAFSILDAFVSTGTMPLANNGGYHILGMIATMLFFLCECKMIAQKGKVFTYLACGQIALVLNVIYNLPLLVSVFRGEVSLAEAPGALLFLAFSLYIAQKLATLSRTNSPAAEESAPSAEAPQA